MLMCGSVLNAVIEEEDNEERSKHELVHGLKLC